MRSDLASKSTTTASGLILAMGLIAMQLARTGENDLVAPFLWSGVLTIVVTLVARWLAFSGSRHFDGLRRWVDHPRTLAVVVILGSGGLLMAVFAGAISLANEEKLMAMVLCAACALFALKSDTRSMNQVALLGVLVTLFCLPAIRHDYRFGVILVGALLAVFFLLTQQPGRMAGATWVYAMAVMLLVAIATWVGQRVVSPRDDNPWYAAVVPASGGPGQGSASARRGVGDGPDEITGNSPDSVGFDQSDNFSESARDGLYDMWLESYGEPQKDDDASKMVGLKPEDVNIVVAPDRQNLQVGRQFELRRKKPGAKSTTRGADQAAKATLFIKGPLPAYVPLAVFHDFDGTRWTTLPLGQGAPAVRVVPVDKTTFWLDVLQRPLSPAFDRELASYAIKIGDLGQSILPLPTYVERFRMGRVNRTDFFAYTRGGLIRMTKRTVPAGATLDVQTKIVVPDQLKRVEPALPRNSDTDVLNASTADPRVHELARQWGEGHARGWRQIEAVLNQLRTHVTHDRDIDTSAIDRPVEDLLFHSRRGSDYQIASAAVLMLRSLGYATRLASGLFADESHVDPESGFALLTSDNVHFWVELRLADGMWITLDATPGYPQIAFPRTVLEWATLLWTQTTTRFSHNWPVALVAGAALALLYLSRRWIYDRFATLLCVLRGPTPREALRLIELRAKLAGRTRPASTPVARWVGGLSADASARAFADLLNRALYSGQPSPSDTDLCRRFIRTHTRQTLNKPKPT